MKHSIKARVAAISVAAAVALTFSGCANAPSNEEEMTGTVRILANITPVLTKEYYEGLVAPYLEAHPGVEIVIEAPTGTDVQSTLQQQLAAGTAPDIVASNLSPVLVPQLTPFPDEEWVNDTPLAQENALDGDVWQVATGAQIVSLVFYNKDAFEAAGITEIPKSLDEFTAALTKLKAAGYVPLQTAGEWVTGFQFSALANPGLLGSDSSWFDERNSDNVTFADSAYSTFLDAYSGWVDEGLVQSDALGLKYQDSIDGFTSGTSATYIMGNWIVPSIDAANVDFEVGVFPVPTIDGSEPKQSSGPAQPYSILKSSPHQALALDIVKYLVTDPTAIAASLASEGNFRKGVSYDASPLNAAVAAVLDASPGFVIGTTGYGIPAGFADQLNLEVQSLYTGTSAADATANLDTWWTSNAN